MDKTKHQDQGSPVSNDQIFKFRKDYYERIDFTYWQDRLFAAYRRYNKLKKPENKAKCLVDIYSIYIQVIEILIINMRSLTVRPDLFLHALAMKNYEIRDFGNSMKDNGKFLIDFTHNFVYKIRGVKDINREAFEKINFDIGILKECLGDYSDNFNFLNSYKHGYRVRATHGSNYVTLGTSPENSMQIFNGDSSLTYYVFSHTKEPKEQFRVTEVNLTFKHMRIFGKALFAIHYLQNMRLSVLASYNKPKKVTYPTFFINDIEAWNKDFGGSRFATDLFTFVKG